MLILVVTTCDKRESLQQIAEELVRLRLAACCQIDGPIQSCYRWNGQVEVSEEFRCTVKTQEQHYDDVESLIRTRHPYEQPQIYAMPVSHVEKGYLDWVRENTRRDTVE